MADHAALTAQFAAVTGATAEQAVFYLEAAQWNLDAAVASFFDSAAGDIEVAKDSPQRPPPASEVVSRQPKIATLGGASSSSRDADQGNTYFAGGDRSGVAIQGPPKSGESKHKTLVEDILKQAASHGPRPPRDSDDEFPDDEESDEFSERPRKPQYFTGVGHRLGTEEDATALSSNAPTPAQPAQTKKRPGKVVRTLTFWKNGFSIDDGELFPFDDPKTQQILMAIQSGRAPVHVLNIEHGQAVDLRVAQRTDEDYVPPPAKPFSGQGHRLGAVVPGMATSSSAAAPSAPSAAAPSPSQAPALAIDSTQPVTTIQIRLVDGTRMVAKFNHTHTVGDLRGFVANARPSQPRFTLHTTFPMKELTEDALSLQDAGLLNTVVVQKLAA